MYFENAVNLTHMPSYVNIVYISINIFAVNHVIYVFIST